MKDFGKILKQAQNLQRSLAQAQEELDQAKVTGEAAGGLVQITLSGRYELLAVKIDQSIKDPEALEMIEELVQAALKDALEKVKALTEEKLKDFKTLGADLSGLI